MKRDELIAQLRVLPADIETAEQDLATARLALMRAENKYIIEGLPGKNEQGRKAHLQHWTFPLIENEEAAQRQVNRLRNEFAALRAVSRLLAGSAELATPETCPA